jgi:hypothetical protein
VRGRVLAWAGAGSGVLLACLLALVVYATVDAVQSDRAAQISGLVWRACVG